MELETLYTEAVLNRIRELASMLTPPAEIAAVEDLDEDILKHDIRTHGHPVRRAYLRGYSEAMQKLRRNQLDVAEAGSPMAVATCRQYAKDITADLDDI